MICRSAVRGLDARTGRVDGAEARQMRRTVIRWLGLLSFTALAGCIPANLLLFDWVQELDKVFGEAHVVGARLEFGKLVDGEFVRRWYAPRVYSISSEADIVDLVLDDKGCLAQVVVGVEGGLDRPVPDVFTGIVYGRSYQREERLSYGVEVPFYRISGTSTTCRTFVLSTHVYRAPKPFILVDNASLEGEYASAYFVLADDGGSVGIEIPSQ